MSTLRLATLRATLPSFASVEQVRLDAAGYDAHGKYWGRGKLFRLSVNELDGMQLDVCVRCYSEKAAIETLLGLITVYNVRFSYWQSQDMKFRARMTALDWDVWCDRAAMRDVAACL